MASFLCKLGRVIALVWQFVWTPVQLACALLCLLIPEVVLRKLRRDADQFVIHEDITQPFRVVGKKLSPTIDDIPTLHAEMRRSFDSGRSRPVARRKEQIRALRRLFSENEKAILDALRDDLGRPTFEALYYDYFLPISEIDHMLSHLDEYMKPEPAGPSLITFPSRQWVYKEPLGVVLVIGTWNYPIMLSLVPVLGAIAGGNTVVLKPSNISSATARLMGDLVPRYLDPTIVSVVGPAMDGDRHTTGALLEHKWDHIFFTGSPSIGKVVAQGAAKFLTPCTLELGGKNPVFVAADANLNLAAKRAVWGRMMNAGQQCIAPDYVLVEAAIEQPFLERCAYWAKTLYGEDTMTNGNLGRVVGDKQMERLADVLKNHGGKVVYGGQSNKEKRYIAPTVLHVSQQSPAMEEETFGPILLVTTVESVDEAIRYVNQRPKPLSMYIFTSTDATAERIIANTSAGGVTVNGTLFHVGHPGLPFGGVGESGMGAYHGRETFNTFVHRKAVLKKSVWPDGGLLSDPFFLYPPWTPAKERILRTLSPFL